MFTKMKFILKKFEKNDFIISVIISGFYIDSSAGHSSRAV
jgi:hypothetical protein